MKCYYNDDHLSPSAGAAWVAPYGSQGLPRSLAQGGQQAAASVQSVYMPDVADPCVDWGPWLCRQVLVLVECADVAACLAKP